MKNDEQLKSIVRILSDFGQSSRYYNLNVVLGIKNDVLSPDMEWNKLENTIFKEDPRWSEKIHDPSQAQALFLEANKKLTIYCEQLARSLSRLFTIGGLGDFAYKISGYTNHFLLLMDKDLGKTDYGSIEL